MERFTIGAGALLMACNAILGIGDGYHKVGADNGGAGGAKGGGPSSGGSSAKSGNGGSGMSGSSGSSTTGGGTGGNGNAGDAGMSASGQAGDGDTGGSDTMGAGGSARGGSGGAGGTNAGGTGGSSSGNGGTGGNAGQVGQGGTSFPGNALVTSEDGAYFQTGTWTESGNTPTVTVDDATVLQNWEGFGMTFTEAGALHLLMLTEKKQDEVLELLFGATGAHFAWGHIPIGANGYSRMTLDALNPSDRYTEDETPGDYALDDFSIDRDKQALVPFVKAALGANPALRFWASPWTPPTWMKDSGSFDGGNMKGDAATLSAYANYFVRFVQEYAKLGVSIERVAPQTEPSYTNTYPSCIWTSDQMISFIASYLGPAITAGAPAVQIMLGKLSNPSADNTMAVNVLNNASAKAFVRVLGYEYGMYAQIATVKPAGLPMWQTEHQAGNYPWQTGYKSKAPNDHAYAVESWDLIREWIAAGVTQYSAWHAVLDRDGVSGIDTTRQWAQNSLITVDRSTGMYSLTPTYYVFRHLSQFVDPGAKVVDTGSANALGFKNPDGSLVAVMYNSGAATTYTVAIGGKRLDFAMPAAGWATLKLVN